MNLRISSASVIIAAILAVSSALAAVPVSQFTALPNALSAFMRHRESRLINNFGSDKSENFVSREVDLNDDGKPEYFVRVHGFLCGATGNCSTWVVKKIGNGFKVLLYAGSVQEIRELAASTKGYANI